MASFSFLYRSKKDVANISLRLIHKDIDYVLRTPFISYKEYWFYKTTRNRKTILRHRNLNELKGSAKLKAHKDKLTSFVDSVEGSFIEDSNNGIPITKEWFKETIKTCHNIIEGKNETEEADSQQKAELKSIEDIKKKNLLLEAIKGIYAKYSSNPNELKKFKTTTNWVNLYEKFERSKRNNSNFNFKTVDFNQKFIDNFKSWGITVMKYKTSTVVNHLKRIKRAVEYAYVNDSNNEIKISKHIQNLKYTSTKEREILKDKIVITLNFAELEKIDKLDLTKDKVLREIQKCILIGCETGLRYSDFNQLNDKNLKKTINGIEYWEFRVRKTKQWVQIIKNSRIKHLIKKYGEPTTTYSENDDIFLNKKIKKVCEIAKINDLTLGELNTSIKIDGKKVRRYVKGKYPKFQLIQTRTFRRSFATNYYGKLRVEYIMQVTGHTTEKMLKEYINVHDDNNIEDAYKMMEEIHIARTEGILKKVE